MLHHKTRKMSATLLIAMSALLMLDGCRTVTSLATGVPGRLVEEDMALPARFVDANGTAVTLKLEAIVMRPDDDKQHPLVLINHPYLVDSAKLYADHMLRFATEFARRGMVVVAFTRRGFGLSEGQNVEKLDSCSTSVFLHAAQEAAQDQREVIRLMKQMSYVDGSKILSLGFSGGALGTLALSADPPAGLVAALNIAGGGRLDDKTKRACTENSLTELSSSYGRQVRIPMLWLYAENDKVIPIATGKRMYEAFTAAGGHAQFSVVPPIGTDGHKLLSSPYLSVSMPYLDSFLAQQHLLQQSGLIPFGSNYYIHHPY